MLLSFDEKSRKRKSLHVFSLVALLIVGVAVVKTTFAANISLNSGTAVEYGQGITQATACSGGSSLTLTPAETFTNASNSGAFYLSSIAVTNVPAG